MASRWLRWGRCAFAALLLASGSLVAWRVAAGLQLGVDLLSLVTGPSAQLLREVAAGSASQGRLLLEGRDLEPLRQLAQSISAELDFSSRIDVRSTLRALDGHTAGLLAPSVRRQLQAGKYREVADESLARLFGVAPPLVSVKRDPLLLASSYVESLQRGLAPGWTLQDGYPVCERDGRAFLLLDIPRALSERETYDLQTRMQLANEGREEKVWCCGAVFHSSRSAASSRHEINLLSGISLVAVVALGWVLLRGLRFLPQLLFTVGSAFLVATAALLAVYPHAHVLTFLFGTSLIGLSVDYVYHSRVAGGAGRILKPLTCSMLTSVVCFAPLLFAEVGVLRQMALFAGVGLLSAYASVLVWGRIRREGRALGLFARREGLWMRWGRLLWQALLPLLVVAVCVVSARSGKPVVSNDPAGFYRPCAYLAEGERKFAALNPEAARRFAYVRGSNLQEALEREERAGLSGLSAIVPSLKRQRENAQLVQRLIDAEGARYREQTGLPVPKEWKGELLDPERIDDEGLRRMMRPFMAAHGLLVPCAPDFTSSDPDVVVVNPRAALQQMFAQFFRATLRLLLISLVVLVALLFCIFPRRAFMMLSAMVMVAVMTLLTLGIAKVPITFFSLLCFFVLIGLGLDYMIFNLGHPRATTRRAVLFSFLTSLVGLGMLAFTEFPVTHAMGCVFAFGLLYCYLFSAVIFSRRPASSRGGDIVNSSWYAQREQSAGRLRMLFMWWVYRLLGKHALKLMCVPVMLFIYPFATPARRALQRFYTSLQAFIFSPPSSLNSNIQTYKHSNTLSHPSSPIPHPSIQTFKHSNIQTFRHLLGFAWSICDKLDVCTLKRNLPKMSVRDDEGWREFSRLTSEGKGAFIISSHLGSIEVLSALAYSSPSHTLTPSHPSTPSHPRVPFVHAFQQMGHDAVFMRVFMEHFDSSAFRLHAVENIGVETAVEMKAAISRGELVLMAGDRESAGSVKMLGHDLLGQPRSWPKGVFTFAKLMESPVFFVTCVRVGWNAYEAHFRRFSAPSGAVVPRMLDEYAQFLQAEILAHPEEWHNFY